MNEDEYKRLTEMMDTCITHPVDESVTAPYNVKGLLTDSELRPFARGDTSYKACWERQAKKLVEENKMTPDLEQIFCVKRKPSVEGGSYDEEMKTNECAEEEELYHNDDMVLPEGRTTRRFAKNKVTYHMDSDEKDSNDDKEIKPRKKVKSNKSGNGKKRMAINRYSDEFELDTDVADDADESDAKKLTKNKKKPVSQKGEKKDEEMPKWTHRWPPCCAHKGCQKQRISGRNGFCCFHFGQNSLPITNSNHAFVN